MRVLCGVLSGVSVLLLAGCVLSSSHDLPVASPEQAARLNVALGLDYLHHNDNDFAKAKFLKAWQLDPNLPEVYAGLGAYYAKVNEVVLAQQNYQQALNLGPHNAPVIESYAVFLCSIKQYPAAFHYFERAIAEPSNIMMGSTYMDAGNCAQSAERYEAASGYYKQALIQDSHNATAYWQLAQLAYRTHNYSAASGYLEQYNALAAPSADSLQLAINIAKALGNRDQANSLTLLLQAKFPSAS